MDKPKRVYTAKLRKIDISAAYDVDYIATTIRNAGIGIIMALLFLYLRAELRVNFAYTIASGCMFYTAFCIGMLPWERMT